MLRIVVLALIAIIVGVCAGYGLVVMYLRNQSDA